MRKSMRTSSKPSKITFSAETEELIKGLIARAEKFKSEADRILSKYQPPTVVEEPNQLIENIFLKFHSIATEMKRRHEKRPTFPIDDEYDVQDLLRALLKIHFADVRREEETPSYAGASGRIDILLKQEKIGIEVKMTRKGLRDKTLGEQLIKAIARYQEHPHCEFLYCFVYDPEMRLSNPNGLEKDLTKKHDGFEVKVFIAPKRA